jgi:hypothetical protein
MINRVAERQDTSHIQVLESNQITQIQVLIILKPQFWNQIKLHTYKFWKIAGNISGA